MSTLFTALMIEGGKDSHIHSETDLIFKMTFISVLPSDEKFLTDLLIENCGSLQAANAIEHRNTANGSYDVPAVGSPCPRRVVFSALDLK